MLPLARFLSILRLEPAKRARSEARRDKNRRAWKRCLDSIKLFNDVSDGQRLLRYACLQVQDSPQALLSFRFDGLDIG